MAASELSLLLDRARRSVKQISSPVEIDRSNLQSAAVCMILKPIVSLEILLLQRRIFEGDPWSGHIAFPGGKSKPGEDPFVTVRREVKEEVGINLDECEVLGHMDEVFPGNFSIRVTPFVAIAPPEIEVSIEHDEIEEYFWIPRSYFLDKRNSSIYSFTRQGRKIETPSYVYKGKYVIWGMTLKIIENFLSSLD